MQLDYYHRDTHLGQVTLTSSPFPTTNLAYFCQDCGHTWGRVKLAGSKTWRMVYRSCGCNVHDALSSFEPGLFELSPYLSDPQGWRDWAVQFEKWPAALLQHELLTLLKNLDNPTFYDSLSRNPS